MENKSGINIMGTTPTDNITEGAIERHYRALFQEMCKNIDPRDPEGSIKVIENYKRLLSRMISNLEGLQHDCGTYENNMIKIIESKGDKTV